MPPIVTNEQLREAVGAFARHNNNKMRAARELNIPRTTLDHRLQLAASRGLGATPGGEEVELPDLPSSELEPEEMMDQRCSQFNRHQIARDARQWFEIKIKRNDPIGLAFVGDPHIDNPGCNWPLLRDHIRILESTPGLYATNMGDLTDNWIGRLERLYADQEMSKKQAWKLAKYLLKDTQIRWLCHILGNHDAWGDGPYLIKANARPLVPVVDWQARFQLVFPNGRRVRIHAAHDFPGTSIWNKMHGPMRASMLWDHADIFVAGHKHEWQIVEQENSQRGFINWLLRCRGYKFIDSFAEQHGYWPQKYGASVTAIVDPAGDGPAYIRCFSDLAEAAEFLTWKRSRADATR